MTSNVLGIGYSLRNDRSDFSGFRAGLEEAVAAGVEFVELPLYAMSLLVGGRIQRERLAEYRSLTAEKPLRYTVHGPLAINLMDDPVRLPLHMDVLKASIEVSAEFGAVHYVLHGGMCENMPADELEAAYARQRDALQEIAEFARERNIIVVVETLFTYQMQRHTALPSRLARELAAIDHPNISCCFDFSHGFINSTLHGADFTAEARALAPFARHLHIHDSFGRPVTMDRISRNERVAFGIGDLHLPLGWGSIPWNQLMDTLDFPDRVIFMLELPPQYWSELAPCVTRMRELADRLAANSAPGAGQPKTALEM